MSHVSFLYKFQQPDVPICHNLTRNSNEEYKVTTEALAREAFNKEVAEEIIRCTEKGYKIEPTENSFEAYEEGYYAANHSLISLEQLTINT